MIMKTLLLFAFFAASLGAVHAQNTDDVNQPPYKRFPGFPPVKLLGLDSAHLFSKDDLPKNRPVLLMIFNPECDHCKHETEQLIANIAKFKKIQVVMATTMPFAMMRDFVAHYNLSNYTNIKVGQDIHFFLPPFFKISSLPFLAFYDKHKQLLTTFEGSMPIDKVLETFEK